MEKYILTSQSFTGHAVFGYSDEGRLVLYQDESQMNDVQLNWLYSNFPWYLGQIEELAKKVKGKLEEIPDDLSFDRFWERYGKKINRKRCLEIWNKMKESDRMQTLRSIEPYNGFLKRNSWRSKADPEKYLKELYETNWNAEK